MRVLLANKFFYPRGGAERYFLDLVDLLPGHGHPTAPFSMHHPKNAAHEMDRFFVSHVDYAVEAGPLGTLAAAARTVYNREARRKARALIREFRPDVAHLHNIHHQLTGSLIDALHEEGVPVVQTLHDYQWVCPVYTFVSGERVCEACRGGRFYRAVIQRCQDRSWARSGIAALELTVGRWRQWIHKIDRFLAPSSFMAEKMIEHGLPAAKVRRQNYALRLEGYRSVTERGSHALYAGRLSPEKGVETLVEALTRTSGLVLHIAGTGPLEPELRRLCESRLPNRVRFLGHLPAEELRNAVAGAGFVVVPSEWYENQPFAVLESFALATPVVGARIGGIPELVVPGETGELFESGSVNSLVGALERMQLRDDRDVLGRSARRFIETNFDPGGHAESLAAIYAEVAA